MDLLHLTAAVDIQAAAPSGDKPATFSIVAYSGGIFSAPNWPESIIDLAGAEIDGPTALLLGHRSADLEALVGRGQASIEANQLLFRGTLTRATPAGQLAIGIAKDGVALEASVGYEPTEVEFVQPGKQVAVNGQTFTAGQAGLRIARRGRLREVSLVSTGGDPNTAVSIAAQAQGGTNVMGNENQATNPPANPPAQPITAAWDQPGLSDPQRVEARWNGTRWHCADQGEGPRQRAQQAMIAASRGAIPYADFERVLLTEQYRDSELARIRAERPQAPAVHGSRRDMSPEVIEASLCATLGVKDLDRHFMPKILDAASSPQVRHVGLQELLIQAAAANGYSGRPVVTRDNLKEVLAYAMPPAGPIQAAFSTLSLPGILSNLANKVLLDGFNRVPQKWREVAAIKSVSDFKTNTFYRLTADLEYEEIGPTGEIKHGTLGEESYTGQARTYARMLGLTRTDIINDDLGAFDDLRTRIGMGGAIALNKLFWATWLSASDAGTFWTEARGNLVTAPFGDEGIATALATFRSAQAPDGNLLDLEPDRILTGPTLEAPARRFYVSAEIRDPTAAQRDPTANIWQNRYRPVAVAQLENEAYTGYSASTWYLATDPAILASAAVLFLDGVQTPTVESSDADFDQLGIQFRGYHDFGVSMSEYRASVKCVAGA